MINPLYYQCDIIIFLKLINSCHIMLNVIQIIIEMRQLNMKQY